MYEAEYCQCGKYDKYPKVNSYCQKWFSNLPPVCLLKGGLLSRYCPGAKKLSGKDIYITSDEFVCSRSAGKYSNDSCEYGWLSVY